MRSYSETEVFTTSMLRALAAAEQTVAFIPDRVSKKTTRCHEVARVVEKRLVLAEIQGLHIHVYDGHYGPVEHSWLVLTEKKIVVVLDTYAVGRLPQVQLLTPSLGHADLYRAGEPRGDIRDRDVELMMEQVLRMEAVAISLGKI